MARVIRNWIVVFVVMVVLTLIWHQGIFGRLYPSHLDPIVARDANGNQAPRMVAFLLAHIVAAIGFVFYVPALARTRSGFIGHGAVMGLVTFGMFALLSHGLFQNWSTWLMGMDICFGVLGGAITGFVMSYLAGSGSPAASAARVR